MNIYILKIRKFKTSVVGKMFGGIFIDLFYHITLTQGLFIVRHNANVADKGSYDPSLSLPG